MSKIDKDPPVSNQGQKGGADNIDSRYISAMHNFDAKRIHNQQQNVKIENQVQTSQPSFTLPAKQTLNKVGSVDNQYLKVNNLMPSTQQNQPVSKVQSRQQFSTGSGSNYLGTHNLIQNQSMSQSQSHFRQTQPPPEYSELENQSGKRLQNKRDLSHSASNRNNYFMQSNNNQDKDPDLFSSGSLKPKQEEEEEYAKFKKLKKQIKFNQSITIHEMLQSLKNLDNKRKSISTRTISKLPFSVRDFVTEEVNDKLILAVNLDETKSRRVIRVDAERTRIVELKDLFENKGIDLQITQIADLIERTLAFYTLKSQSSYKQGYNELLGPFLWLALRDSLEPQKLRRLSEQELKTIVENKLSLSYCCLDMFVTNFMPTLFIEDDFVSLQSCFSLIKLLLKYHDPQVFSVLQASGTTPELYATSWFFTFFANKCSDVEQVLDLWNKVIQMAIQKEINRKFIFGLSVALIIHNRSRILVSDPSELPGVMSRLSVSSSEQLDQCLSDQLTQLVNLASAIIADTPMSFWESDEMNVLFGENSAWFFKEMTRQDREQIQLRLENMSLMPLSEAEFFFNIYPDVIQCPNPKCLKFCQIYQELTRFNDQRNDRHKVSLQNDLDNKLQFIPSGILIRQHCQSDLLQKQSKINPQNLNSKMEGMGSQKAQTGQKQISQSKSPFKNMVKQQQIEADASVVPIETDTNIREDESDKSSPLHSLRRPKTISSSTVGVTSTYLDMKSLRIVDYSDSQLIVLNNFISSKGVDVTQINFNSLIPFGPTFLRLCSHCLKRLQGNQSEVIQEKRIVMIDCRVDFLQRENMLPCCAKFDIGINSNRKLLFENVRRLADSTSLNEHFCMIGLNEQEQRRDQDFQDSNSFQRSQEFDKQYDIKEFHKRVLDVLTDMFLKESIKFVSQLPGGFDQCHSFIETYNLIALRNSKTDQIPQLLEFVDSHDPSNCYHCFTRLNPDPIVEVNSNLSSTPNSSIANNSAQEDFLVVRNNPAQFPPRHSMQYQGNQILEKNQEDNHHSTQDTRPYSLSPLNPNQSLEQQEGGFDLFSGLKSWLNDNFIYQKLGLASTSDSSEQIQKSGSLPGLGINDNSSRPSLLQDVTKFTRQNILKSKINQKDQRNQQPGVPENFIRGQTGQNKVEGTNQFFQNELGNIQMQIQRNQIYTEKFSHIMRQDSQSDALNNTTRASIFNKINQQGKARKMPERSQADINDVEIKINELSLFFPDPQRSQQVDSQLRNTQGASEDEDIRKNKRNNPDSSDLAGISQGGPNSSQFQFLLEERAYYFCNGIQRQQSYIFQQEKVRRIIEQEALSHSRDIIVYHVKRLASSNHQYAQQQKQLVNIQHPIVPGLELPESEVFGKSEKSPSVSTLIITRFVTICLCQYHSQIHSRFFMHDLIKITSRRSSSRIITFYFRIPQFGEYHSKYYKELEGDVQVMGFGKISNQNAILDTYNENPRIPYILAQKRQKYHEIKLGFEFSNEDEARDCIERVSDLYKRLKSQYAHHNQN